MRKYFKCLAILGVMAVCAYPADTTSANSENVMKAIERIVAKAGISFDGEFRSQFLDAYVGGNAVNPKRRDDETVEFTSVDFDIKARPNTITQGRVIFRMEQDWRNFYSDISNPIFTRWISIDGSLKGMFSYNVGDFRQKYTPLTLYTPDIDILYEPEIFSKQREVAQNEVFIDNNQKLLQGVNMNFDAEVYPVFNELKANVLGTRLRSVQTNITNGSKVASLIDTSRMEKFMLGSNLDMTFLKGFSVGGNFIDIFDNKGSYDGAGGDSLADTMAQNTRIGDIRGGVDVGALVDAKNWKVNLSAEMAFSSDDSSYYNTQNKPKTLETKTINGNALLTGIDAEYKLEDMFKVFLDAKYINNTSDFRNELAQSPNFVGRRIMNLDNNDSSTSLYNVTSPLYSSFDALYQQVFKFCPSEKSGSVTNWWYKEPFSKNSYTNMVFTQAELSKMKYSYLKSKYLDPSLQLVMPFGPATPNRTGINANVSFDFLQGRVQVKALGASLKEIDPYQVSAAVVLPKTVYTQIGGGAKIDVAGLIKWKYPFYISSSVVSSEASNDGLAGDTNYLATTVTSVFYCENLYFKFWKRLAFLGGVEIINNKTETTYSVTTNQLLSSIGLEYKLTDGSYLTGTIGQIDVTHENDPEDPSVYSENFNQKLVGLFLRVMF